MHDSLVTDDRHGLSIDFYPGKKRKVWNAKKVAERKAKRESRRQEVYDRDGNKCLKCGKESRLSLDHIKPKSKGGGWSVDNLQTLCRNCNTDKGDTEIDYRGLKKLDYDVKKLKNASWWSNTKNRPSNCLIVGTETKVNLGWFTEIHGVYILTPKGEQSYKRLLENNHSINKGR